MGDIITVHFHCGSGSLYTLMPCLRGRGNTSDSIDTAEKYASSGLIDPLENLKEKRHYIFHGTQDTFIHFGKISFEKLRVQLEIKMYL